MLQPNIRRILEMQIIPANLLLLCLLILIMACERSPIDQPSQAMRLTKPPANLMDDLPLEDLAKGVEGNIEQLRKLKNSSLIFGPKVISKEDYIFALDYLASQLKSGATGAELIETVLNNFDFYEVYGKEDWGEVLITSYYHPVIPGSRTKTTRYSQALYSVPPDLVNIRLDEFVRANETLAPIKDRVLGQTSQLGVLRGRLVPSDSGGATNVLPYYTRGEIENGAVLERQNVELAWVDPIDAFFLHVQGSGTVTFDDGKELRLGYAAKNGYQFVAISKYLKDIIPGAKMSMQAIDGYLRQLPENEMREILNKNPSYIFFQELKGNPVTSLGAEVVEGRTIATDLSFFPKGALAYMEFVKPVFDIEASVEPIRWETTSRFVLDQDTGSAIRGPHRVDLYWGRGKEAGRHAGAMKNSGRLYYLVPKDEFLESAGK